SGEEWTWRQPYSELNIIWEIMPVNAGPTFALYNRNASDHYQSMRMRYRRARRSESGRGIRSDRRALGGSLRHSIKQRSRVLAFAQCVGHSLETTIAEFRDDRLYLAFGCRSYARSSVDFHDRKGQY